MELMVYHVCPRGVHQGPLFRCDDDRSGFLDLLAKYSPMFEAKVLSWVLMTNHYHLQIEMPPSAVREFSRRLNHAYSLSFNLRNSLSGHTFEERSKAFERWGDAVIPHTARYNGLNPVKAGIARTPAEYPWSSYPSTIGLAPKPDWQDSDRILRCFSADLERGRIMYQAYVESLVPLLDTVWRMVALWEGKHPKGSRARNLVPALEFTAMTSIAIVRSFPFWELDRSCPLDEVDIQIVAMMRLTGASEEMMALLLGVRQQAVDQRVRRIRRVLVQNPALDEQMDEMLKQSLLWVPSLVKTAEQF